MIIHLSLIIQKLHVMQSETLNQWLDNLLASFSLHSEDVALTSMKTMGVSTLHSGVSYF